MLKRKLIFSVIVFLSVLCMAMIEPKFDSVSPAPNVGSGYYKTFCEMMKGLNDPASLSAYHERGCDTK